MGIKERMNGSASSMVDPLEKIYREERQFRGGRLVEKWARVPEIGDGLPKMDEKTAVNLAILLENQARVMSKMTEAQLSTNFQGLRVRPANR